MTRIFYVLAAVLVALPGGAGAQDKPAVAPAELEAFRKMLRVAMQKQELWEKENTKELKDAEAAKIARVNARARPRRLAYLRLVMRMEENLRLLGEPSDKVDVTIDPPGLGVAEKKRVQELRQKVRDGERKRIGEELKGDRESRALARLEEKLRKDEQSLDALFERNTTKFMRDIERANKALTREKKSRLPSDSKIKELESQLDGWRADVKTIRQFVYGFAPGVGFEKKAGAAENEAGKFLAVVVGERDKVLKLLRTEGGMGGEDGVKEGVVGGSYIISANLGVVLDVSGSMQPHIEKLKKEIAKTFSGPRFREVVGCSIEGAQAEQPERAGPLNQRGSTVRVIEELCVVHGVDTIYWFCDLRDAVQPAGVRRLRSILLRSGASFYVKSVGQRPDRSLLPLITEFRR